MDIFRAIIQKNEFSQRSFDLTTQVIRLNAANYTAWKFRRAVIDNFLSKPEVMKKELTFCSSIASENAKNYQLW